MTTEKLKNLAHKSIRKNTWTKDSTKCLNKIIISYKANLNRTKKYNSKRTTNNINLGKNFWEFYKTHFYENYKDFKSHCDPLAKIDQQLRMAKNCDVCKLCKNVFKKSDLMCSVCAKTEEGCELRRNISVNKREKTSIENWGATNPMKSKKGKANHKKKVLLALGVENAMLVPSIRRKHQKAVAKSHNTQEYKAKASAIRSAPGFMAKVVDKMQATCQERYGTNNPMQSKLGRKPWKRATKKWNTIEGKAEIGRRSKVAIKKKYGVDNVMELDWVKQKMRHTWLEKYGVDHPLKDIDIREKAISAALSSSYRIKTFDFDGKKFNYMGYEKPAIEACVKKYGCYDVLSSTEVPTIRYGEKISFPDIYIKSEDTYIEVKSVWTLFAKKMYHARSRRKAKAIFDAGYSVKWVICSNKSVLCTLPREWHNLKPKQLLLSIKDKLPHKEVLFINTLIKKWET